MTDFKVGDKVEVIKGGPKGRVGTITEHRGAKAIWPWAVEYLKDAYGGTEYGIFNSSELKLVQPKPKFQVGDWVKVHGRNDKWDGTVGTVQKVIKPTYSQRNFYIIHKDDVADPDAKERGWSDTELRFFEAQLEATEATEATEAPAKFKVGDLVTFAEPENDRWQGGKAEVIEGKGQGKYTTRVRIIEGPPLNDMYRDQKGYEFNTDPESLEPWVAPSEAVDGPAHYGGKNNPYEVIKVAEAWGFEKNAYLFNALKYLGRAGKKGSKVEDLKKLVFYVEREIAKEEAK